MKTTTWNRDAGYVSVVLFENGTSCAVSTKTFKTQKGAESFCTRIKEMCGDNYSKRNLRDLIRTTDPKTGEVTTNFRFENFTNV